MELVSKVIRGKMRILIQKKYSYSILSLVVLLPMFCLLNIILGILIFYSNINFFEWYIQEDGYVESLTAIFLFFIAVISFVKAFSFFHKGIRAFYFIVALIFCFGAGEEISWGQRLINFNTPDKLQTINTQNDFTLHNIKIYDFKINKIIFGSGLYTGAFMYFLLFPYLYQHRKWFRNFINRLKFPIPTKMMAYLYVGCFLCLHLIFHDKVWELQELALISFVFMAFLYNEAMISQKKH